MGLGGESGKKNKVELSGWYKAIYHDRKKDNSYDIHIIPYGNVYWMNFRSNFEKTAVAEYLTWQKFEFLYLSFVTDWIKATISLWRAYKKKCFELQQACFLVLLSNNFCSLCPGLLIYWIDVYVLANYWQSLLVSSLDSSGLWTYCVFVGLAIWELHKWM